MTPRTDEKDHKFEYALLPNGERELHSCVSPEHGGVYVCKTCGGDYHIYQEEHDACPLKK